MISDEEKDLYIKSKIKDGNIPPKINDLFENSLKIIEEKGRKIWRKILKIISKNQRKREKL